MSNIKGKLKFLQNKKICILGFGLENQALVKFLISQKIPCQITICDKRKKIKEAKLPIGSLASLEFLKWDLGENYDRCLSGEGKNLDKFDIIFRSPGYPLYKLHKLLPLLNKERAGVRLSSPMKLFFELCPTKNVIGVTGTKGKGTTASLINHILKLAGKKTWLGGNIGIAPFSFFDKIKKNDWVILELSSFQLEDMDISPKIAVITNFLKEHTAPADPNNPNYHKSLSNYWKAKSNIFKWQKKNDYLIINKNLKKKFQNSSLRKKIIYFTKSELPNKLISDYNKENVAAAVEVAKLLNVKQNTIKKAVSSFKGLEHRLEYITTINKVKYFNNSMATTPDSTMADLKSFSEPIILIAGGADKGANFKQLARIIKKKVKFVILLKGQATPKIKKELIKIKYPPNKIKLAFSMEEAVKISKKQSSPEDIVLLSPACASFGLFINYKDRGEIFKREVIKYYKSTN
ncbi:MAG: UDP-N-acetylmuramoyl-L-alanine--D-glutamate ligase [Patescibacteria group bacterium]